MPLLGWMCSWRLWKFVELASCVLKSLFNILGILDGVLEENFDKKELNLV